MNSMPETFFLSILLMWRRIGSDVTFLLLRVIPGLRPGVLVHFHDIFYPMSYPAEWIRAGWAWNESLFLRAFLVAN